MSSLRHCRTPAMAAAASSPNVPTCACGLVSMGAGLSPSGGPPGLKRISCAAGIDRYWPEPKVGTSQRKNGDFGPIQANIACPKPALHWRSPGRYHNKLPNSPGASSWCSHGEGVVHHWRRHCCTPGPPLPPTQSSLLCGTAYTWIHRPPEVGFVSRGGYVVCGARRSPCVPATTTKTHQPRSQTGTHMVLESRPKAGRSGSLLSLRCKLGFGKPLERPKTAARSDLEMSAGCASPSSRGL